MHAKVKILHHSLQTPLSLKIWPPLFFGVLQDVKNNGLFTNCYYACQGQNFTQFIANSTIIKTNTWCISLFSDFLWNENCHTQRHSFSSIIQCINISRYYYLLSLFLQHAESFENMQLRVESTVNFSARNAGQSEMKIKLKSRLPCALCSLKNSSLADIGFLNSIPSIESLNTDWVSNCF